MNELLHILIIDDDEVDRMSLVRAMQMGAGNITVTQAVTAKDGLTQADSGKFDVILLDYRLPDGNGIDVLSSLRAGTSASTAIIIISQHEDETLANEAIDRGAQDFLLNPR